MTVDRWLAENVTWKEVAAPPADNVQTIRELTRQGLQDLSVEFSDEGGIDLLSDIHLEIAVHGQPASGVGVGQASTQTNVNHAAMKILALSAHPADARTIVDEPMDRAYLHKTLVHELSMLFLWQVTVKKRKGWKFFSSPPWFHDGYQEYLALTRSSRHSFQATLPKYRLLSHSRLHAHPDREIDPHLDGSLILEFMHDVFGRRKVIAILRSERMTFTEALHEPTSRLESELLGEWREWMLRGPYTPTSVTE